MHRCELSQGQAEWQTLCCIKVIPSLDTGWLLKHICATWPSLPSGLVHFPGGFSDPHESETLVEALPRIPPDKLRACLDPGVKMAWTQTSLIHKQQWECQRQRQGLWEGRTLTSDWAGEGRHLAGYQSERPAAGARSQSTWGHSVWSSGQKAHWWAMMK